MALPLYLSIAKPAIPVSTCALSSMVPYNIGHIGLDQTPAPADFKHQSCVSIYYRLLVCLREDTIRPSRGPAQRCCTRSCMAYAAGKPLHSSTINWQITSILHSVHASQTGHQDAMQATPLQLITNINATANKHRPYPISMALNSKNHFLINQNHLFHVNNFPSSYMINILYRNFLTVLHRNVVMYSPGMFTSPNKGGIGTGTGTGSSHLVYNIKICTSAVPHRLQYKILSSFFRHHFWMPVNKPIHPQDACPAFRNCHT
jgi:hypothetical protein